MPRKAPGEARPGDRGRRNPMRRFRLPAAALALAALLTSPGITAHGQGGPGLPGYLPPGEYTCHSSFATFHTVVNGTLNVDATVSQATCSNQPKPGFSFPPGGSQTILTIDANDYQNFIFLSGCYLLSPTDFVPTSDLSSMTLITTTSSSPSSSCGGPGTNSIPDGTKVNLQWLGTGPVASSQNVSHFSCTAYTQENQNGSSNNLASVSGTIGFLNDPLSNIPGFIASGHGDIHVSGIPDQTCPPGGNGFGGAGPGPLSPGNYDFRNNQAFAIFATPDFSQFFELTATTETDTANPQGPGTPASTARTNASGTRTNGGPVSTTSAQLEIRIEN